MLKTFLIFASILALATTATTSALYYKSQQVVQENVRVLKRALTKDFHDPESARFRSIRLHSLEGNIYERIRLIDVNFLWSSTPDEVLSVFRYDPKFLQLCGEVNAKNGFGAYVGYKRFYIMGGNNPVPFVDSKNNDDFAKKMCEISEEGIVFSEPDSE